MSTTTTLAPEQVGALPPAPTASRRTRLRRWRYRAIVLLMVAAAVLLGTRIAQSQTAQDAELDLGNVLLTSQPIPVETSLPGLVTKVDVQAGDRVEAGQQLGTIRVTTTNSQGKAVLSQRVLRAPRDGVVVDDPLTLGSTLQPGVGFVELYDPSRLTLVTEVPVEYLTEISPGMTAELTAAGLDDPVDAVVQRVVPRIGSARDTVQPGYMELVLVPTDAEEASRLVPGLRLTGSVDTSTGDQDRTRLTYVG